ncbi:MAG: tetratricopeptide repeat protein [Patescibacteria group bacterium]
MYNIIPVILILLSLSIIIVIVARKFSVLANLDVNSIQEVRETRVKEKIISDRFKRNITKWSSRLIKAYKFTSDKTSIFLKWSNNKLQDLKDSYKVETILPIDDKEKKIKELFVEADELCKKEMREEAEKRLIEIIGLDSKNIDAFTTLGHLYFEDKNYQEAKETFNHILKLMENEEDKSKISEIYFNLSLVNQTTEDYDEALVNLKEAIEIEPNNPRYLDTMIEISIINKDKVLALDAFEKLKEVNPDNQKLKEFKKQIKEL